jgi:hypothetical protein
MTALDEIVARALVGSQRAAGPLPPLPGDLAGIMPARDSPECALLDAAAACSLYAACGVVPMSAAGPPAACPPDEFAECTPRAGNVLAQLLRSNAEAVLVEWLQAAVGARRRPPHALLPALLDRAAARRDLRELVHRAVDHRGRWLARLNPKWQFAKPTPGDWEAAWQTGARDERLAALRLARQADPGRGRQLVEGTWSEDPADDRVRWVGALTAGLSMDDEPFLEACLDDRSSRVREAVADLLARLPASRLVVRMAQRVQPLFTYTAGQPRSIVKLKAKQPAALAVTLPGAFDKGMLRDGMTEKPSARIGKKQWWLQQLVAGVPPGWWTKRFAATAAELVAAVEPDFADVVVTGWRTAASRHAEPAWALALANCPAGDGRWYGAYVAAIPEAERPGLIARLPEVDQSGQSIGSLLAAWGPVSAAVSRAAVAHCTPEQLLNAGAAMRLHPAVLAELEPGLTELTKRPYVGRVADEALTTIALRRAIAAEFAA